MHYMIDVLTAFKMKKWVSTSIIGLIIIIGSFLYTDRIHNSYGIMYFILGLTLLLLGIILCIKNLVQTLQKLNNRSELVSILNNHLLSYGLNVVVIGGGTGLSVLLRGLKKFTTNITAVVTVADDGGGSGILREDLGMLPPGDIRNCILALANTEPEMEKLLRYRFNDGSYKNQNLGNLLIAGMVGVSNSFEEAVKKISDIFAVVGKVLPVTIEQVVLYAKLMDGSTIKGESNIPLKSLEHDSQIERVFIKPKKVKPLDEVITAIREADVVIYGPGSLYTSIIPNLLVDDVVSELKKTRAIKVYASNIMTQPGETGGFSAGDHIKAMIEHTDKSLVDYVFANSKVISEDVFYKYSEEGASPVYISDEDKQYFEENDIGYFEDNYVDIKNWYIRHNAYKLSADIIHLALNNKDRDDLLKLNRAKKLFKKTNGKNNI